MGEVEAKNGEVIHKRKWQKLGYGSLAKAAAELPLPPMDKVRLKNPSQFRYIGTGKLKLVDGEAIVTGKAQYGMDTWTSGMLFAVVARPQVYGGKVVSFDAADALKVPGVVNVVAIDATPGAPQFNPLGGVAVIAKNTWAAMQGRKALKIVVGRRPQCQLRFGGLSQDARSVGAKPGKVVRNEGDVTAAMASAAKRIEAQYYLPHLAHASMEPPAATASIVNGKCQV